MGLTVENMDELPRLTKREQALPDLAGKETVVAVLGAGAMGQGIVQLALLAGHRVLWHNRTSERLGTAVDSVRSRLERLTHKGKLSTEAYDTAVARLETASTAQDLRDADLVIESVAEDLELKAAVFAELEGIVGEHTVLATNTSSLSVNALAARLKRPERFLGLHFFNPAPVLPLVEVVPAASTSAAVTERAIAVMRAWGKKPVLSKPTPGFIVNRVVRPFYAEALRIVDEVGAEPHLIDAVVTGSGNFRMGPLRLTDLIGQDVNFEVTTQIWSAMGYDARYTPSATQRMMVEAGLLGRKTGRGFYDYVPEQSPPAVIEPSFAHLPRQVAVHGDLGPAEPVVQQLIDAGWEVQRVQAQEGDFGYLRIPDGPLIALTDGRPAVQVERECGRGVVLFDLALDFAAVKHTIVAAGPSVDADGMAKARALVSVFSKQVSTFPDSPGLVVARTVCMLVNQAVEVVAEGVCTAGDVETAVRSGVNYPDGLLAWGDRVGSDWVCRVLDNLAAVVHPTRYRVTPALRIAALGNQPLNEENQ